MTTFTKLQSSQIDLITSMMIDFYAIDNYPIDKKVTKQLFKEFIDDENYGKSYLIYKDDQIVGYFILSFIFSFEFKGRLAFLDELYICENSRGTGIGRETIVFIKKIAPEFDIKMMYLEIENHNQMAQKLYLANGFESHNRKIMKHKF